VMLKDNVMAIKFPMTEEEAKKVKFLGTTT
jgi:hypothetical protein